MVVYGMQVQPMKMAAKEAAPGCAKSPAIELAAYLPSVIEDIHFTHDQPHNNCDNPKRVTFHQPELLSPLCRFWVACGALRTGFSEVYVAIALEDDHYRLRYPMSTKTANRGIT